MYMIEFRDLDKTVSMELYSMYTLSNFIIKGSMVICSS